MTKIKIILSFCLILNFISVYADDNIFENDTIVNDFMSADPAQVYRETFLPAISRIDSFKIRKEFEQSVDAILDNRYLKSSEYAIAIYSLDNNEFYYSKNIKQPLTPASTTKLLTTYSALKLLGVDHKIQTSIFTDAESIEDTLLNGNIYIVGKGDAMFTIKDLECMAEDIQKLGIKTINGNIYADGSFFDGIRSRWEYSGDHDEVQAMPPVTALSINDNKTTIIVTSGRKGGQYVNVNILPQSETFSKWVTAKVRASTRKSYLEQEPDSIGLLYGLNESIFERAGDEYQIMKIARGNTIKIGSKYDAKAGKQLITVSGYLYPNKSVSYQHYILEPELTVAGALKSSLEAGGIKINGVIGQKSLHKNSQPNDAYLLAATYRNLNEIISITNKNSDNYYAENLFKMLGGYNTKHKFNIDGAKEIILNQLQDAGINTKEIVINDGSGLSRRNLVSAESLIKLLIAAENSNFREQFKESLSIAGVDGTLKKRMKNGGAYSNLKAKTGTLRNVSSLSGYVNTIDGERLCFAFLFRGNAVSTYKSIENELGSLMSEFFYYSNPPDNE